jgi:hypothetical protein
MKDDVYGHHGIEGDLKGVDGYLHWSLPLLPRDPTITRSQARGDIVGSFVDAEGENGYLFANGQFSVIDVP